VTSTLPATLIELLRIPSVSADPAHAADVRSALEWAVSFIRGAGGDAHLVRGAMGPLVVGEIRASPGVERAPDVLCYGHLDVQPPAPLELWTSPPFEPTVRGGWLYCRGVADDKAQLWLLLEAARTLAAERALPVNVRVLCDAEEEIGGTSAAEWVAADARGADACVVFDTSMLDGRLPAIYLGTRGTAYFHLRVRTGRRDLHSGIYGGAALNAIDALVAALAAVFPREDGRLPEPLCAGTIAPSGAELASWAALPPGAEVLARQGARPTDPHAAHDFYLRTWAEPSLSVNGIGAGSARAQKAVLPVLAEANLSLRLAHGQTVADAASALERLLRAALPTRASLDLELVAACEPSLVAPGAAAVTLAMDAFERALGVRPLLVRTGGSLPLAPALAQRGIPAVLTGFDVPEGNIHAPDERFRLDHLELGVGAAREVLRAYAGLR
jgi:acetylornithine deacetylase/succinyl-diaminopimelate desuccinylase-like protein